MKPTMHFAISSVAQGVASQRGVVSFGTVTKGYSRLSAAASSARPLPDPRVPARHSGSTPAALSLPVAVLSLVGFGAALVGMRRAEPENSSSEFDVAVDRRTVLASLMAGSATLAVGPSFAKGGPDSTTVGAYLPPLGKDDLFLFVPSTQETPSIRAGTIDPSNPYTFALPGGWKRQTVSNAINGNFCQPKCGEPWTEVVFTGPEGRCQVIAAPLDKLTGKFGAILSDIGPPEVLINAVGPYMTGTYIDEESVIKAIAKTIDGHLYYDYELDADYGTLPPRVLASVTTKGEVLLIFSVNATYKQWASSEPALRAMAASFRKDAAGRK